LTILCSAYVDRDANVCLGAVSLPAEVPLLARQSPFADGAVRIGESRPRYVPWRRQLSELKTSSFSLDLPDRFSSARSGSAGTVFPPPACPNLFTTISAKAVPQLGSVAGKGQAT